jgi:membrane protein CcdC involved in cytochrome C biogenesis
MSDEIIEKEYVFINIGDKPIEENNLIASPVLMSTGEANFVNEFLEEQKSEHRYELLDQE